MLFSLNCCYYFTYFLFFFLFLYMSWKTVLMLLFFTSLEICWTPKESKYNTFFKKLYNAIQWNLVSKYSSRCAIFALSFILVNCFYQRLFWLFFFFKRICILKKGGIFPALTNFTLALNILVIALVVALSVYKFPNKFSLKLSKSIPQDLPLCSEFLFATIMVTPFRIIQNFSYS